MSSPWFSIERVAASRIRTTRAPTALLVTGARPVSIDPMQSGAATVNASVVSRWGHQVPSAVRPPPPDSLDGATWCLVASITADPRRHPVTVACDATSRVTTVPATSAPSMA